MSPTPFQYQTTHQQADDSAMIKDEYHLTIKQPQLPEPLPRKEASSSSPFAEEQRQDDTPSASSCSPPASVTVALPAKTTTTAKATQKANVMAALLDEQWDTVERLCEEYPSMARDTISMICQGENSTCLPLHFCSGRKSTPVSTIDSLVTAHPSGLLATESSGGRLPLHIAVLKGASFAVVRYLCEALPQSMSVQDQEGNLPLHYAAMHSSDAIVDLLVRGCPKACRVANKSERLPLHILCARCWDFDVISIGTYQMVLDEHKDALQVADRRGRMPLHVCCSSDPRADVLQVLVPLFPQALLVTDKSKLTPLELARKFSSATSTMPSQSNGSSNVVLAYLMESTNKERRKKYKFLAPFKHVGGKIARRRAAKPDVDALHLHYCYG